jgi:putative transposase
MKRSKFTEQQIAFALQQAETGTSVEEVCRKMGVIPAPREADSREGFPAAS